MLHEGQFVSVSYIGRFEDGEVFDRSDERDATLDFEVGGGNIIAGFDSAVRDMEVGETREVIIAPDDAYGQRSDDKIQTVSIEELADGEELARHIGSTVYFQQGGDYMPARVSKGGAGTLLLDFNHPMAGKTLVFEITLVAVADSGDTGFLNASRTKAVAVPAAPAAPGEKCA